MMALELVHLLSISGIVICLFLLSYVFSLQASANTIVAHFLGLVFSLELLRSVTLPPSEGIPVPRIAWSDWESTRWYCRIGLTKGFWDRSHVFTIIWVIHFLANEITFSNFWVSFNKNFNNCPSIWFLVRPKIKKSCLLPVKNPSHGAIRDSTPSFPVFGY